MRPHYLGDTSDVVKQGLIRWLYSHGPWVTHPMFTEAPPPGFVRSLERLLWAPVISSDLLERQTNREQYFGVCRQHGSLFLDPNTGLSRSNGADPDYLYLAELLELVCARPGELTMVFDQSLQRGNEQAQVSEKLIALSEAGVSAFAYVAQVAFVFASTERDVAVAARDRLISESRFPIKRFTRIGG